MDNCPVITCEPLKTNWLRQYSLGSLIAALCVALMVIVGLAYKIHRLVTAQTLAQANEDNFANFAANMQNGQENEVNRDEYSRDSMGLRTLENANLDLGAVGGPIVRPSDSLISFSSPQLPKKS